MGQLIKILIFSFIAMSGFVGFTWLGIPLVVPAPPPVEEKLTGDITMEQYVGIGKKIFFGKGTCTLCHSQVGGRAPLLHMAGKDGPAVGARAETRLKDARYEGESTTGEEYLHESMVAPSAFVVAGYGKKGTNDTVSPMPDVSKGAIGLSDMELGAVIAFLQDVAGIDVTVELPSGDVASDEEDDVPAIQVAENPKAAFEKFGCGTCHMHPLIEEGGDVGPDLSKLSEVAGSRKAGMSAHDYLVESIVSPNAFIVPEFDEDTMPDDFAEQMTVSEMNMIIDALLGKKS